MALCLEVERMFGHRAMAAVTRLGYLDCVYSAARIQRRTCLSNAISSRHRISGRWRPSRLIGMKVGERCTFKTRHRGFSMCLVTREGRLPMRRAQGVAESFLQSDAREVSGQSSSHKSDEQHDLLKAGGERSRAATCRHTDDASRSGKRRRVVVGMSGGVDSSVAALLLQRQGYDVRGVFMHNWDGQDEAGTATDCQADKDYEDARAVGERLGIPVEKVQFIRDYWVQVFAPSLDQMVEGLTPNIDVLCNRFIKFKAFRDYALDTMGADLIATGHYARIAPGPAEDWENPLLLMGLDAQKDQSYFLSQVPSSRLTRVLFPLGELTKSRVRELATEAGLPVANKRESMGLCFVGKRKHWHEFVSEYVKPHPGNFVCADTGKILGRHQGVELYTIGQKAKIGGLTEKSYIAGSSCKTASVIIAKGRDHPMLESFGLTVIAASFRWIAGAPPLKIELDGSRGVRYGADELPGRFVGNPSLGSFKCMGRFRHGQQLLGCTVHFVEVPTSNLKEGTDMLKLDRDAAESQGRVVDTRTVAQCGTDTSVLSSETQIRNGVPFQGGHAPESKGQVEHDAHPENIKGLPLVASTGSVGSLPTRIVDKVLVMLVVFDEPVFAVAPGQTMVLYDGDVCLGGGEITTAEGPQKPIKIKPPPVIKSPPKEPAEDAELRSITRQHSVAWRQARARLRGEYRANAGWTNRESGTVLRNKLPRKE